MGQDRIFILSSWRVISHLIVSETEDKLLTFVSTLEHVSLLMQPELILDLSIFGLDEELSVWFLSVDPKKEYKFIDEYELLDLKVMEELI